MALPTPAKAARPAKHGRQAPKTAPEGMLLFVLMMALLVTLATFFLATHPVSVIELPLSQKSETQESSARGR